MTDPMNCLGGEVCYLHLLTDAWHPKELNQTMGICYCRLFCFSGFRVSHSLFIPFYLSHHRQVLHPQQSELLISLDVNLSIPTWPRRAKCNPSKETINVRGKTLLVSSLGLSALRPHKPGTDSQASLLPCVAQKWCQNKKLVKTRETHRYPKFQ